MTLDAKHLYVPAEAGACSFIAHGFIRGSLNLPV